MKLRRFAAGLSIALSISGVAMGCAGEQEDSAQTEDELRVFPVSEQMVTEARRSRDPAKIARVLRVLAADRTVLPWNHSGVRVERMKQLFDGMSADDVRAVRAAYIAENDEDPEITIRSDGLFRPVARLDREVEIEMLAALNGAAMTTAATTLADMLERAQRGALTAEDRSSYFALLPMMGLWDAPVRAAAGDRSLDAIERTLLARAWSARGGDDVDRALRQIEAKLPPPDLAPRAERSKSIAVIASSHGAQWQELMDWAVVMHARGFHLQVFTPEGRPVAFQRDSLSVSVKTTPLGFGCPRHLDPAGTTGQIAAQLLANAASAASFDARHFGAVYLAGGLGFNEDVAFARPSGSGAVLTTSPNVAGFMRAAIGERLPMVAICHGPTLFAATPIVVGGRTEMLNAGIATASLPPFESYVGFTGRKEIQFTYDVNTHEVLEAAGGRTSVVKDIADMTRVVKARKADIDIITGPGPQAAQPLAEPTIEALARRWGG